MSIRPLTPFTSTSARAPPLVAGSMVSDCLTVPEGVCSQYPPPPMVLMPWKIRPVMVPLRLLTVALTMPLSRVQEAPLSTTVTGALTSDLATAGRSSACAKEAAAMQTKTAMEAATNRDGFIIIFYAGPVVLLNERRRLMRRIGRGVLRVQKVGAAAPRE